ncbi:MAG: DUF4349 domain-containing protein [Cytophagia bacterium]|nr:MAG: DUF4349 domain-containing protein [Cytophagia bacterium]TAG43181.1 MAG: DUF4349 domain-containing protein [Cytophagia bacterium]
MKLFVFFRVNVYISKIHKINIIIMKSSIILKFLIVLSLNLTFACSAGHKKEAPIQKEAQSTEAKISPEYAKEETKEEAGSKNKEATNEDDAIKTKTAADNPTIKGITNANLESQKNRKFLRTAETKMKVKNVQNTTRKIEDLVGKYKGFITYSNMKAQINRVETNRLNIDSLLELKFYEVNNEIILRVPNPKMDSLLRDVQDLGYFIDYINSSAEDVALQMLKHQLQGNRYDNSNNRVQNAIDSKGKNLYDVGNAENNLLERQLQSDNNKVAQMELDDKINYSSVKIYLYQKENILKENIINPEKAISQVSFWQRMGNALSTGLLLVQDFVVLFTHLWLFWLILIVSIIIFRQVRSKK